jgi:hypothetical protein
MAEDESGTPRDSWDGVNYALYYGDDRAASADRIVIDQLKYSAANPDQAWTVARLTQSSNKRRDNSVIGRLAKAFAGLKDKRPDLVASGNVVVRLVSNQRVDREVVKALSSRSTSDQRRTDGQGTGQLAPYKDVLKVLDRLRPDDNPFRYFGHHAETKREQLAAEVGADTIRKTAEPRTALIPRRVWFFCPWRALTRCQGHRHRPSPGQPWCRGVDDIRSRPSPCTPAHR